MNRQILVQLIILALLKVTLGVMTDKRDEEIASWTMENSQDASEAGEDIRKARDASEDVVPAGTRLNPNWCRFKECGSVCTKYAKQIVYARRLSGKYSMQGTGTTCTERGQACVIKGKMCGPKENCCEEEGCCSEAKDMEVFYWGLGLLLISFVWTGVAIVVMMHMISQRKKRRRQQE